MKKILITLLVAALMAAFLVPSVFATDAPQVVVESKNANPGEEIILTVSFKSHPGFSNGCVLVTYDENALELVDILVGNEDEYDAGYEANTTWKGLIDHNGPKVNFAASGDTKRDMMMFEIVLKVKDNAAGNYEVGVVIDGEVDGQEYYVVNNNEEKVAFEVVAGVVSVAHECTNLEDVAEVPATCMNDGVKAHQKCSCGKLYVNGELVEAADLVIPAAEHDLVHMDAVDPGCHMTGNIEYWYCKTCETVWQDAELTQITNRKNVVLPATGGDVVHMEAVEPGCHFKGHIEHWYCNECEQVWEDEALTRLTTHLSVIRDAIGGEVIHVEAKEATCYEDGNIEHWYCEQCEQVWEDEALTQLTNHQNVKLGAGHDLVHVEAVEPGCHFKGHSEHWYCKKCETVWSDEALTQITNQLSVILPELGGDVVHVEAVAPTCTENGNIEYWYCAECEQVWQDEARTQLTNFLNVVDPALGHTFVDGVCSVCGTGEPVPPLGDVAAMVFALVAVSGMGLVALTKKKED